MGKIKQYCIKSGFSFHQLETDHAVLLHETQSFSLMGELYVRVLSEIDKKCPDIISSLEPKFSAAEIYYAISQLEKMGYITQRNDESQKHLWWSSIEQGNAIDKILCESIAISSTSLPFHKIARKALTEAGFTKIAAVPDSKLALIVCNDYLEPEVALLQKNAFEQGASYCFPVKLSGKILWLGPLFKNSQKPCWHCLIKAIQKNRPIENYLSKNPKKPILPNYPTSPASLQFGMHAAIMQLIRKMIHKKDGDSELITIDMWDLSIGKHCVRTRPQCEVCGDPSLFSNQVNSPIELNDIPRHFIENGGYRAIAPETTWENYKHLVSPLTGIISHIDKYDRKNHQLRPVWKATYFVNPHQPAIDKNERFVKNSFGKGDTADQSRASALGEAIERYSFLYTGEEHQIKGAYNRLKPKAVDPETLQHFSRMQYASRDQLNKLVSPQKIPLPFDPDKEIAWTPAWCLTSNTLRYLPLQFCYALTPTAADEDMFHFSSNGSAAGNCLEEAILQGFLELIERDATAIWWYNRITRPGIDLESFHDIYFNEVKKHYKGMGWNLWILDVTHDLQIPSVVALAKNDKTKHFAAGLGCHLSMRLAIQRAITEMHQIFDPAGFHDPVWTEQEIDNPSFLFPDKHSITKSGDWPLIPERSLKEDIMDCAERIKKAGMELLVLNYTRPDIGFPTVKVIVPGLRHFWKQLSPGRLYTVPVKMGWLGAGLTEELMNPKELPL
jgi:oxazoline/thiazoline synthase